MKTNLILLISFMLVFTFCKHENKKIGNYKEELHIIKKLCFIKSIDKKEKYYATIDLIDLVKISDLNSKLTYPRIIELPDNYCYYNKEEKYEEYEISDSVKIIMQKFSYDADGNYKFNQSITLTDFVSGIANTKNPRFLYSPFELEIVKNKITSIKEIYIP